jgi:zinc protease
MKISVKTMIAIASVLMLAGMDLFSQTISNNPADVLPMNPKIKTGKLSNGLTYFVLENKKPEKKAELRLLIKTGSLQEDNDQLGLAHFIEHMCFNGTKNFPKNELVEFLQKTGVRFGADLNASTSFDRTQYILPINVENKELYEKSFQVLEDWAHNVMFADEEIDNERGIIISEWRQRSGVQKRIQDIHFKKIMQGSRFLERDVIGDTNIIKKAPYDAFKRYYKDWYRPDLMAVVVVGDIDVADVESKIKEHFSKIEMPANPRAREEYTIPYNPETLVSIATDKEMPATTIQIYFRQVKDNNQTYGDFRRSVTRALYDIMFIQRLQEISRSKDAPFLNAFGRYTDFMGGINVYMLMGFLKENNILGGYETLLTEAFRVSKHGFAETEFDRAKSEIASQYEKRFNEKDKTESAALVREISGYFYENESIPGIELEKKLIDKYLKDITLNEVNELAKSYLHKENTVIALSAPDKLVQGLPTEEQLLKIFNNVNKKIVDDYFDDVALKPLFNKVVTPGKITEISKVNDIEATVIKLDNGAKVILKPTNFKNDEVLFSAISKGGSALASDKDYLSAGLSSDIMEVSGIADFKYNQLLKLLTGKNVSITTDIGNYSESMRGSSTPEDLETMFQLIYLGFTSPRMDKDAFFNYIDKLKESLRNKSLSPDNAFSDTISVTMSCYHPRTKPLDSSMLSNIDLKTAYEFYKNRFANAGDFTFVFVGNIDIEKFKPLIVNYIASLPSAGKNDPIKDMGIKLPIGNINKVFQKGLAPKANVRIIYSGKFNYSEKESYSLKALVDILRMRITKDLREEKGGIYSPGVFQSVKRLPEGEYQINIDFDCAAADVEMLVNAAKVQAENLKTKIDDEEVAKVKAADKNLIDLNLKSNSYWLTWLTNCSLYNDNLSLILKKSQLTDELNSKDLIESATRFFNSKNIVKVVMYPENFEID